MCLSNFLKKLDRQHIYFPTVLSLLQFVFFLSSLRLIVAELQNKFRKTVVKMLF